MPAARAALLAIALAATTASAGMAESWYLARGRANSQIGNHAAAIEAYRKALEANPGSREASRALGVELQRNGETDRAVAEFDRHLARFPDDWELAFEQARLLQWSRYAYRAGDAVRYLRMGLAKRDDPARRRELARLLGRSRATLDDAIREYDRLLAASPGDAQELRDERLRLLLWDPRRRGEAMAELSRREAEHPGDERVARHIARLAAEDPARAAEAADRYAALLVRHPDDRELALGRARALARAGRRAEAREAYARALAAGNGTEARLEYADLLAADPGTRAAARVEYAAVLRESPRNRRARLALARVLSADRDTSRAAIVQYEAVLAESPRDPEAHRGLARAYAWNGDPDRALAHAIAGRSARPGAEQAEVESALRRGREPGLGLGARALAQPGTAFRLSSLQELASGSADPTPFTSGAIEGGVVTYRGDGQVARGSTAALRAEWRPSPGRRLDAAAGWDGARASAGAFSGELRWERQDGPRALALSVSRTARRDSFRALAGEVVDGRWIGAASDNVVGARAGWSNEAWRAELSARAGAVTGAGMPGAFLASGAGRADRTLLRSGRWALSAGTVVEATHHARDLSGQDGDPAAPRLFSPPLFVAASPRISLAHDAGLGGSVVLDAGPALQLISGPGGAVRLGGDARAALVQRLGDRIRLTAELRVERIADVYSRAEGAAMLAVLF